MRKTWFMLMWVALLLGQIPLAGSVVICTTEDGRAHVEGLDHHGHAHAVDHEDHDHLHCHADACVLPAACCQDITLDCLSPSLVHAKRMAYDVYTMAPINRPCCTSEPRLDITSISHYSLDTGQGLLRSVILLI